jgi:peptidoglycan lytic transglycosylase
LDPRIARQQRVSAARQRRRRAQYISPGPRPDRVAGWAVALGVLLILLAGATSRAATTGGAGAPPGPEGSQPVAGGAAAPEQEAAQAELRAKVSRMPAELTTWYGPGFYGRRTACGNVLHRSTQGVAHRRLPCGTPVTFYYRGRLKTVPVIDRGPYARASWDLTQATARDLGVRQTTRVQVLR